jgi:hypothetical protein
MLECDARTLHDEIKISLHEKNLLVGFADHSRFL